MDFDGGKKKGFVNWKHEEKDMKELRTLAFVFGPGIALCFLFSINSINLDGAKRLPAVQTEAKLSLVEDESKTWYSQVKKGIEITVASRR